jgi:endonuclease G, mitochondrial
MDEKLEYYQVENLARDRIKANSEEIINSVREIARGNPFAAEPDISRRTAGIQRNTGLPEENARAIAVEIGERKAVPKARAGAEAIQGAALEFLDVAFLDLGRRAADCVARVARPNGAARGSGVLIAPGLFMTNNHVISSAEEARSYVVELDLERDIAGRFKTPTRFSFDPATCFVSSGVDGFDFSIIALGGRLDGAGELDRYGFVPLLDTSDKHSLGEVANVIQHPEGRLKEVVLHENRIVARDNTKQVLHYVADTQQGSSGSPVFNNHWEIIALHHWAGPFRETVGVDGLPLMPRINEGIRISAIVKALSEGDARFEPGSDRKIAEALTLWAKLSEGGVRTVVDADEGGSFGSLGEGITPPVAAAGQTTRSVTQRRNRDGSLTLIVPVEVNVSLGGPAIPAVARLGQAVAAIEEETGADSGGERIAAWKTEDFTDRGGYEPGFLPGFIVPMPDTPKVPGRLAVNQLPAIGSTDPHELPYHHFSVKMNAGRGLCYFTACNIDGARIRHVNRTTKTVTKDPSLNMLGLEALTIEGVKGDVGFNPDRRILPTEQMTNEYYASQNVPGFPNTTARSRIARIFQRGHVVLRSDPAWGSDCEALAGERDTFFFTNICPQVGFFNQGSRPTFPGEKGKLHWRAVETYVLRNAVAERQRVSVFAGPVFTDNDFDYRFGSKIPLLFWKIAAWVDEGKLRTIALLADQKPLIEVMPEALGDGSENFADTEELDRISQFLTTVADIEDRTGLDFGSALRNADVRGDAGGEPEAVAEFNP